MNRKETASLSETHPAISKELDPSKNEGLCPETLTRGQTRRVLWTCHACSHEWIATVNKRTSGRGCPRCWAERRAQLNAARVALRAEKQSLESHPLASEWHPLNDFGPNSVALHSFKKVWWLGSCGHEWKATISGRVGGKGCPFCVGRYVSPDTSLLARAPTLATEWHPIKNGSSSAADFTLYSNKLVWWLCSTCGHEWQTKVQARATGRGCGNCSIAKRSKVEIWILFELAEFLPDVDPTKNRRLHLPSGVVSVDGVLSEAEKVLFEYDGCRYHVDQSKDEIRLGQLTSAGWRVVYVRELPLLTLGPHSIGVKGQSAYQEPHKVAALVMVELTRMGFDLPGLESYLKEGKPIARTKADEFIASKRQRFHSKADRFNEAWEWR